MASPNAYESERARALRALSCSPIGCHAVSAVSNRSSICVSTKGSRSLITSTFSGYKNDVARSRRSSSCPSNATPHASTVTGAATSAVAATWHGRTSPRVPPERVPPDGWWFGVTPPLLTSAAAGATSARPRTTRIRTEKERAAEKAEYTDFGVATYPREVWGLGRPL